MFQDLENFVALLCGIRSVLEVVMNNAITNFQIKVPGSSKSHYCAFWMRRTILTTLLNCIVSVNLVVHYSVQRKQFIQFNDRKSKVLSIRIGVPQGSVLGPLVFHIQTVFG